MSRLWVLSIALVSLAWYLNSLISPAKPPITNFGASVFFDPQKVESPGSKEEIVQIVQYAIENGQHVRVLGSGHSRSDIALSDDIMISLHRYNGVVDLDKQSKQVTVEGGMKLSELVSFLDKNGLALSNLPAITEQSIAGAISTATHGSGVGFVNMAAMVTKLELITGEGKILTLSAQDNKDIFNAAQVSLGLLGIITEVTFQCVSAFDLEETSEPTDLADCIRNLDTIINSAPFIKLWVEIYSSKCVVFRYNKTGKPRQESEEIWKMDLKMRLVEPFLLLTSWFPSLTPAVMELVFTQFNLLPAYTQVGPSYEVLVPQPYYPGNEQTEIGIPLEHCTEGLKRLKDIIIDNHIPANLITEIRFVKADDIWMSPNYNRDSCHFTLMTCNLSPRTRQMYFNMVYDMFERLNYNPRYHFGKVVNLTPSQMRAIYPKFDDFLRVQSKLDPQGIFVNDMLEKLLGL